eukprot:224855-Chlamydomonas_euryale.AAC.1
MFWAEHILAGMHCAPHQQAVDTSSRHILASHIRALPIFMNMCTLPYQDANSPGMGNSRCGHSIPH